MVLINDIILERLNIIGSVIVNCTFQSKVWKKDQNYSSK